jgi:hypothetical protein
LVAALLNQQTPETLLTAAVGAPLGGFIALGLVRVINALAPVLWLLLLGWGALLLVLALVKFAQRFLWRFSR